MITEDRDVRACGPSDRAAAHHWQPLSPGPAVVIMMIIKFRPNETPMNKMLTYPGSRYS